MQIGFAYRTTIAAAAGKLSKACSYLITNLRFINSAPNLNTLTMIEDNVALEEKEPSFPKSKRRCRIDLGVNSEQKSVENITDVHHFRQNQVSLSHETESYLPTSFGKKKRTKTKKEKHLPISPYGKFRQSNHECDMDDNVFDICIPSAADEAQNCKAFANDGNPREKHFSVLCKGQDEPHKNDREQCPIEESEKILRPGMVLFKNYIRLCEQVEIVKRCRELGCGTGGFYRPGYNGGAKLRLRMMCLGLDWNAQTRKYGKIRQEDNASTPDIPHEFKELVNRVIEDCHSLINRNLNKETKITVDDILPAMSPDICIVNFYTANGRLGLHQDRDESRESLMKGLPVVSISIGDSAEFLFGDERDIEKAESVLLESGDVLVFGGESRNVFHGVPTIYPNTAPLTLLKSSNIRPGRLNLTFRKF